jgi:hypothetical protein
MKNTLAGLLAAASLLLPFAANAGQSTGQITYLAQRADGLIYVTLNANITGSPGCATHSYFIIYNENSDAGKRQFAMLVAAKAGALQVRIYGKNTCTRWSDGEDIDEVWLVD